MKQWTEVRRRVLTGELSKRAACREYQLNWHTLVKMLAHDEPPGYRQRQPRKKPKLEPFLPIIYEILEADKQAPKKQRHTATRIFQRLKEEHGYDGGYTSVRKAVREWKRTTQEVFLPLRFRRPVLALPIRTLADWSPDQLANHWLNEYRISQPTRLLSIALA